MRTEPAESTAPNSFEKPTPHDTAEDCYELAIGDKNKNYYLSRFQQFDDNGIGPSWNWPAFFVSFYWLLYRKMWGWGVLYALSAFALNLVLQAASPITKEVGVYAYLVYVVCIFTLIPMYANAFYYGHLKKKILRAKALTDDRGKQFGMIAAAGGTSKAALIFIFLIVGVTVLGILAAIALPAYQDFTVRAKVSEAMVNVEDYKRRVEEYTISNQAWPESNADIGLGSQVQYQNIQSISVIDEGDILIRFAGDKNIQGKSIVVIPLIDDEGSIYWECEAVDVPKKYTPARCRN